MTAERWRPLAERVGATCRRVLPGAVGVYVHGSAALGGLADRSDLDVLVVTSSSDGITDLGDALLELSAGDRPLELSVVDAGAARAPAAPWPYLLHVNSAERRWNLDDGVGDPDLLAHYAVTRAHGISIAGPPAAELIGPVPPDELVRYFIGELEWGLEHGDQRYAVLNSCRAVAYAETGELLSKVDGADWWLSSRAPDPLVDMCLTAQQAGHDLGPCDGVARGFVGDRIADLRGAAFSLNR